MSPEPFSPASQGLPFPNDDDSFSTMSSTTSTSFLEDFDIVEKTPFTKFAIAGGTGKLGCAIVRALAAKNLSVLILTRMALGPTLAFVADPNISVAEVPTYKDEFILAELLRGQEVVIDALSADGPPQDIHLMLAKASVRAEVELFVPNDFSIDLGSIRCNPPLHPFLKAKQDFHHTIASLGLARLSIINGAFPRALELATLTIDWKAKRVTILDTDDETDNNVAVTSEGDVGRFMANLFTTLTRQELYHTEWKVVGCRMPLREMFSQAGFIVDVERNPELTKWVALREIDASATWDSFKAWWALAAVKGALDIPKYHNQGFGLGGDTLPSSNPISWLFEEAKNHQ